MFTIGTVLSTGKPLRLPEDAITQTFAFLGRKGSGKTYATGRFVEELIKHKVQVVILDTVGNWYGLRLAADGKSPGIDIPVLGGVRGDIPLSPDVGERIADVVVETGRSMILDVSQFGVTARQRFATAFAEQLWIRKKGENPPVPIHLVIEESQVLMPQRPMAGDKLAARMLGRFEELVRLGRNYGIGISMLSQRPQSVNKEVLNQAEPLLVFQTNGAQERKALRDWIVAQGADVDLIKDLPGLKRGTAFLWSPQWLEMLDKVSISAKATFDSTATPKPGARHVKRELKPLDLEFLRKELAAMIQQSVDNDPRQLQDKVHRLERQLHDATHNALGDQERDRLVARVNAAEARVGELEDNLRKHNAHLQTWITDVHNHATRLQARLTDMPRVPLPPAPSAHAVPRTFEEVPPPARSVGQPKPVSTADGFDKYEQALFQVLLDRSPVATNESMLAALSGRSHRSSAFLPKLNGLIARGLVTRAARGLVVTEKGRHALPGYTPAPSSGKAALAFWLRKLPAYESKILRCMSEVHPRFLYPEEISQRTGYSVTSSAFKPALRNLLDLGHITESSGGYKLADVFIT